MKVKSSRERPFKQLKKHGCHHYHKISQKNSVVCKYNILFLPVHLIAYNVSGTLTLCCHSYSISLYIYFQSPSQCSNYFKVPFDLDVSHLIVIERACWAILNNIISCCCWCAFSNLSWSPIILFNVSSWYKYSPRNKCSLVLNYNKMTKLRFTSKFLILEGPVL